MSATKPSAIGSVEQPTRIGLLSQAKAVKSSIATSIAALSTVYAPRNRGLYAAPTLDTAASLVALTAAAGETGFFTQAHTAIAGRLYEITVQTALIVKNTGNGNITVKVKIGATVYGTWIHTIVAGQGVACNFTTPPTTLPAGANTLTVTVQTNTDTVTVTNSAAQPGCISVKDLGL